MELWKHGVEQTLAVADMQNQETERKTLARQISSKVRRSAMCSSSRNPEKGDILSTGLFVESIRKSSRKQRQFQRALPGATECKKKGSRNDVTTALRPVMKNGANSTTRRQKAETGGLAADGT